MTRQTTIAAVCLAAAATFGVVTWGQPQVETPPRIVDMAAAGNNNEGLIFRVWNDGLIEYRVDPPSGPSGGWVALPMNPDAPLSTSIALATLRSGSLISVFRHYANGESDRLILTFDCTGDGCTVGVDNDWTFDW